MRHITLEEAKKITHDYYDQYCKQDSYFAMLTAVNTFIDRHNADKLARKATRKAKPAPDSHLFTTDAGLYAAKPEWDGKFGVGVWETRRGDKARVRQVGEDKIYPFHGKIGEKHCTWTSDGHWSRNVMFHHHDLIRPWEEKQEPVKLADYLKDHYDAERGVFDFETPDGAYVFAKGKD
jgi:hypothetical protein